LPLDAIRLKAYAVKTILRKLIWKTGTVFRAGCIENRFEVRGQRLEVKWQRTEDR
jgi:hypothetical protein